MVATQVVMAVTMPMNIATPLSVWTLRIICRLTITNEVLTGTTTLLVEKGLSIYRTLRRVAVAGFP